MSDAIEPPRLRTLVIDDEKNIRAALLVCLESEGCETTAVSTGDAALLALERQHVDVAFLDLRLGKEDGLALIPSLLAQSPGLAIVVITAYAAVESAVAAIRRGAIDYLPKPFTPAQIRLVIEQMKERQALRWRVADLEGRLRETSPDWDLTTSAPPMRATLDIIARAAAADAPVLFRGENGTGKSMLARVLHGHSRRATRPFVVVNCPTLTDDLLASELFGHAKGAFTGAVRDQLGRVEAAEGGTLFLDEIGEISPGLQAKLLRFLQEREFERVGETKTRRADVRILAATNRDLEADVKAGRFREDLLFRVNIVEVDVPPLRQRIEDIEPLARHFLTFAVQAANRAPMDLTRDAVHVLEAYVWPGNVRELKNVMERVAILWPGSVVSSDAFPRRLAALHNTPRIEIGGDLTLEALEEEHLRRIVARTTTHEEAARILGIDVSTLWRKRKRLDADNTARERSRS